MENPSMPGKPKFFEGFQIAPRNKKNLEDSRSFPIVGLKNMNSSCTD